MEFFSLISFFVGAVIGSGIMFLIRKAQTVDTGSFNDKIAELNRENKELIEEKGHLTASLEQQEKWEQKITNAVKNISTESNRDLVTQLLETHNRQAEANRTQNKQDFEAKERVFYGNVKDLTAAIGALKSDVERNQELGETLKNAFSSSANIGSATETILENTLENFKFRKGIDFFTQFTTANLRADAIVILPDENALVIDSKASKFIYELATAEQQNDPTAVKEANENLKRSMNQHLRTLGSKEYTTEVQKELKSQQHTSILRENIPTIMFLPNESAVEKIQDADPNFQRKASEKGIFVCGPTGLWIAIGIAKQKVELHKKIKNYEDIEKFTASVLKNVQKIFKDTTEIQAGLARAQKGYNGVITTLNRNIPERVREMEKLGIPEHKGINDLEQIEVKE